jgi:hypothetical protein
VAIQKILPTRNLRIGHPQNAGWRLRYVRIIKTQPRVRRIASGKQTKPTNQKQKTRKGADGMNVKKLTVKNNTPEPYRFKKRIGSIVYEVKIHFNQDAKETMDDKIKRLIRNEMEAAS